MPVQSSRQRRRVERGIYRQPNGKYAICCRHAGVLRFRTVGFDLAAASTVGLPKNSTTTERRHQQMAIDQTLIGQMAASLMEEVEEDYGEDAKVSAAALVVAVDHGDGTMVHFSFGPDLSAQDGADLLEQVSRTCFDDRPDRSGAPSPSE